MLSNLATPLLLLLCYVLSIVQAQSAGTITAPVANTTIAPGSAFNFTYNIHADYCTSSYAYSVYLVTDPPSSMAPSGQFMNGYFFGRYDAANYPAVPNPKNPAPAQLTMPDFSKPQGGFGGSQTCSNCTFHLMVMEDWDNCEGTVGRYISLASIPVVYNATTS
ncbi:hypothetical protein B0H21DRAFT_753431 [Amylocystis lapponica]|nr:hypothetical protein B0H21DRAFT_753431 [Amylocystis lapponica]